MIAIREMTTEDRIPVIDIFNHYVEHSFAAYPEGKIPYEWFGEVFLKPPGYPRLVTEEEGGVAGFGMLRPHSPIPTFRATAEISCFISPSLTGRGLGSLVVQRLLEEAAARDLTNILASISSLNEGSIRFHQKHGFVECGRFKSIGLKKGQPFDVVWMQLSTFTK